MEATREQLIGAILFFADRWGLRKNYQAIIESKIPLPELVRMITYDMFLNGFSPFQLGRKNYEKYELILNYARELDEKGWVDFK